MNEQVLLQRNVQSAAIHPSCLFFLLFFKPPTHSWLQSKGQIAQCPIPSRTHYTRLEREREQRSLCDTAGQRQTDGGGGGGESFHHD